MNKHVLIGIISILVLTKQTYSQETLQSVTNRGNSTSTGAVFGGNVGIGATNHFNKLNLGWGAGDKLAIYNDETNTDFHGLGIGTGELYLKVPSAAHLYTFYQGNTALLRILGSGNVGIGTTSPDAKLSVNGTIHGREIKVDLNIPAPDYVFRSDYKLIPLKSLKAYIKMNSHLPDIPSASQMEKEGINLGDMNLILLKKIEELTLYLFEKDAQLESHAQQMKLLQEEISALKDKQQEKRSHSLVRP